MNVGTALFFLLILACPLMMIFMMRSHGGHGGGRHGHQHHDPSAASVDELRRQRAELDREIATREDGNGCEDERSPLPTGPERDAQETHHGRAPARR